jgi:iron-sulfur cluster assembly accessory protein
VEPLSGRCLRRGSSAPEHATGGDARRGGVRSDLDHTGNHWTTRDVGQCVRTHTAQGDFHVTTPAQTESTEAKAPTSVVLTDVAAQKVKALIEQEGRDDLRLRVAVQPGGCSGLRYQLFFDERSLDGDVVTDYDGVEVVVDRMSAPYLAGATIDFADRIDAQGFTIDNPNAGNSCACGDSFS